MTATLARIGYGTTFQTDYTLASPVVWETLSETKGLSLPPLSRDAIDSSHECKPDEWRTFVTGLRSGGEIDVVMNFIASKYLILQTELQDTLSRNRRIVYSNGTVLAFTARLMSLEQPISPGEVLTATAKFKIDGAVSLIVP
jgi:hypothetical protein